MQAEAKPKSAPAEAKVPDDRPVVALDLPRAELTPAARRQLAQLRDRGLDRQPVCMAKTQYSFSDDPALLNAPEGFTVTVRELSAKTGAGFVVALTGAVMTMPGLPASPAADRMDVAEDGTVTGLF